MKERDVRLNITGHDERDTVEHDPASAGVLARLRAALRRE
jgi:hypothetical protein